MQKQADLNELKYLLALSKRKFSKDLINDNISKLELQIAAMKAEAQAKAKELPVAEDKTKSKRYVVEVSNYAWDQSPKFVKLYVTIDGVQSAEPSNVTLKFTGRSLNLLVQDLQGKDHSFTVNNLLEDIIEDKSYHKIKTDMVAIYLKKASDGNAWGHLTTTTKRLKEMKTEEDMAPMANNSDPGAGLMDIMRKMYESGDSQTKQMINKVWTEQQEKKMSADFNDFKSF